MPFASDNLDIWVNSRKYLHPIQTATYPQLRKGMNTPPASPCYCHRTPGAAIALGGGSDPGGESAPPLCSRHLSQGDAEAVVSGRSVVETRAQGRGWDFAPPKGY